MEYQKKKKKKKPNKLDNTPDQPSKFGTNYWVEINDDARGTYNTNSRVKFKASMLKSRLWDYSHEYILASRAITINGAEDDDNAKRLDKINKEVISKNCAPFTDCISEINNTQIDNAKDLDVVMLMYNSIEYSNNYLETSGSLWQYYWDDWFGNIDSYGNIQINHLNESLNHSS